jgi:hypothetical protein
VADHAWRTLREKIEYLAATWKKKQGLEMAGRELELSLAAYPDAAAPRVAALEAERDEAREMADRHLDSECRMAVEAGRNERWSRWWKDAAKTALSERNAAESRSAALTEALRALHDIVLAREAGATDMLPDLARAMARARAVLDG